MRRADEEAQAHAQGAADRLPGDSSGAASQWPPHPHSPQPGGAAFVIRITSTGKRCAASRFVHSSRATMMLSSLPPSLPPFCRGPGPRAPRCWHHVEAPLTGGGIEREVEGEREREDWVLLDLPRSHNLTLSLCLLPLPNVSHILTLFPGHCFGGCCSKEQGVQVHL